VQPIALGLDEAVQNDLVRDVVRVSWAGQSGNDQGGGADQCRADLP
jgi:hypothetical protein